jgi:serine/threonine-protein kinase
VRFDLDRLVTIGEPAIVQSNVRVEFGGAVQVAIAGDGSIAYVPREVASAPLTLVWVDRRGGETPLGIDPHVFESPRVSPDGGRVAVIMRGADVADVAGVWVYDLVRRVLSRLTLDPAEDESPLWSPDGRQILYAATRGGDRVTLQRAADGSGEESRVTATVGHHHLSALAPDGRTVAFEVRAGNSASWDVWLSLLGADAEPRPLLATPATERGATFSPDGRWLAYESGESGQSEIYVRAVTGDAGRWQISADGGTEALWSPAGRELFYRSGDRLMVVDVQSGPGFSASRARPLFEGRYARLAWGVRNYDVSPDGQRFLMLETIGRGDPHRIVLVQNWDAEVKRLLPP